MFSLKRLRALKGWKQTFEDNVDSHILNFASMILDAERVLDKAVESEALRDPDVAMKMLELARHMGRLEAALATYERSVRKEGIAPLPVMAALELVNWQANDLTEAIWAVKGEEEEEGHCG